jgi:hypothetical protein
MIVSKSKASKLPAGALRMTRRTKGFSREQIAAASAAMNRQGSGTPKAVLDAFLPARIEAGGIALSPCMASHIMALQKLESGFVKGDSAAGLQVGEIARCLFVFVTPIDLVRELLGGTFFVEGRRSFKEFDAAVEEMLTRMELGELIKMGTLLNAHIGKAFETAVGYRSKGAGGSDFPRAPGSGPGSGGS